ncbi:MAG TPA: FHA domain-containing protein, partial [Anaerolineales bacterium]|nr:FHA domain-containing protein [Anaerolineales bacterium]
SDPSAYQIDVAPPQVTFIQPPQTLARRTDDPDTPLADIPPTFLELPLLITFPDGHTRPIVRLDLFVNGELHETRLAPPFDRVRWDLSTILESAPFQVRAQATDSQGLTASTEVLPITVEVVPGPRGLEALRPAAGPLLAGLALTALAVALLLGWARLGELSTAAGWEGGSGGARPLRRAALGTLMAEGAPEAALLPVRADGSAGPGLGLGGADLVVGSDPSLCALLLDDPSVSGIHARLTRSAAGVYRLRDQHSVAGTWVNDMPVDEAGRDLRHGDRIYFGRLAYRFRVAAPAAEAHVVVRPARRGAAL